MDEERRAKFREMKDKVRDYVNASSRPIPPDELEHHFGVWSKTAALELIADQEIALTLDYKYRRVDWETRCNRMNRPLGDDHDILEEGAAKREWHRKLKEAETMREEAVAQGFRKFWKKAFISVLAARHANPSITGSVHSKRTSHVEVAALEADRAVELVKELFKD